MLIFNSIGTQLIETVLLPCSMSVCSSYISGEGGGEGEVRLIEIMDSKCGELDRQRHLSGHKSMQNHRG